MTTEWRELKTLQEVAAAQAAGDEIEWFDENVSIRGGGKWEHWYEECWKSYIRFRSRPHKKTKTIVLREALIDRNFRVAGTEEWIKVTYGPRRIDWLDTPAREIEVEE